jgi:uncharacterized protein YciI
MPGGIMAAMLLGSLGSDDLISEPSERFVVSVPTSMLNREAYVHYVLFYEYIPDYLERRGALRDAHLERIAGAMERGELFIGGAFAEPADGAMIVFTADTPAVAEEFARADPYVREGLVTKWWVREWTTVVGKDAAQPLQMPGTR